MKSNMISVLLFLFVWFWLPSSLLPPNNEHFWFAYLFISLVLFLFEANSYTPLLMFRPFISYFFQWMGDIKICPFELIISNLFSLFENVTEISLGLSILKPDDCLKSSILYPLEVQSFMQHVFEFSRALIITFICSLYSRLILM